MTTYGTLIALLAFLSPGLAAQPVPVTGHSLPLPESFAHASVRSLAAQQRLPASEPNASRTGDVSLLDEVVVYGQVDPEDYVRRRSKFLALRDKLSADRRATPKETAQALFCMIGLCGVYGPEGIPLEGKADVRTEQRTQATSAQLSTMFRGTLQ